MERQDPNLCIFIFASFLSQDQQAVFIYISILWSRLDWETRICPNKMAKRGFEPGYFQWYLYHNSLVLLINNAFYWSLPDAILVKSEWILMIMKSTVPRRINLIRNMSFPVPFGYESIWKCLVLNIQMVIKGRDSQMIIAGEKRVDFWIRSNKYLNQIWEITKEEILLVIVVVIVFQ